MNFVPDYVPLADIQSPEILSGTFRPLFTSLTDPKRPSIFRLHEWQNVPRPNFASLEISVGMYATSPGTFGPSLIPFVSGICLGCGMSFV